MSYNNWCNAVGPALAETLVGQAHDKFLDRGDETYNIAIDNLNAMDNIMLTPVEFSVNFDFDGQLAAFNRPNRPIINDGDFAFRAPDPIGAAPIYMLNPIVFDPAPADTTVAPSLTYGARPATPLIPVPIAPPNPGELVMPVEPGYVMPDVPTFEMLNIPSAPDVIIPTFDALAPVFVEPPFNETWDFTPTAYTQVMLDELVATLRPMLQARQALPEAIEAAIFQKGRSRIEIETNRNVEQAFVEFGNRGFSEPQGQLAGRVLELRQNGQNQTGEFNREAVIKQFEETLANLRFAITQGAALEGVFVQLHIEEQRFALEAAKFQRDSALALLNARVSVFNARMQGYLGEAQVFESRIRASLATIEVYKAQIDGEKARGEINEQRVRLYEGMLRGVTVMSEFYKTRLDAVKIESDVQRNMVDRYKAEVDAYDSRWRAHVAEWQGYTASVEGEGKRADVYRTLVDAQSKRVDAWSTSQQLKLSKEQLGISQHGQQLDVWKAGVTKFGADIEGERARLAAVGQRVDALARMYTADASIEAAASAATDRSFELGMNRAKTEADFQLKEADMMIAQVKGLIDQMIEIARAKMQVSSQLAASTMSAVGYSASVSASESDSKSCASNFNFQGEIIDA